MLTDRVRGLWREPLLHFLLAGAVIFALFGGAVNDPSDRSITVSEAQLRGLTEQWEQTWGRQPTPSEVDGLIRDYVKDEVYYREALRLGLDQDDIILRRRMRSKMEFLVAAESEAETPSDAALQAWLNERQTKYATNPILSFDQIFVGEDRNVASIITRLNQGGDPAQYSSPLSVPRHLEDIPAQEIDRQFGEGFAKLLGAQPVGQWRGPVASGFGQHIVRLRKITPGAIPPLANIRQMVENDWRAANRSRREAKAYQALLDGYDIRIAAP